MPAPHEIVAVPLTIYLAEIGTDFPAVEDAVADFDPAWELLGTEGANNYDDGGVTVGHNETTNDFTPAGSTMPAKRFRTAESFPLSLNLVDLGPIAYAKVMNDAEIETTPTSQSFSLYRGDQVNAFALIARGMSTVDNILNLQYKFSKTFVSVDGNVVWDKGKPAMLPVKIEPIRHSDTDVLAVDVQIA